MTKLMKYEFRKSMFSKLIILVISGIMEALFLLGIFTSWNNGIGWGIFGLVFSASVGISFIGINSLLIFYRDLNTKQSYMLFMTPCSSYQILGAKVLENGLSLFLAGCFFSALAALDIYIAFDQVVWLKEITELFQQLLRSFQIELQFDGMQIFLFFMNMLSFWLLGIVSGLFAILLSATFFAGKRFCGIISFLVYLLIFWGVTRVIDLLPDIEPITANLGLSIVAALALTAVMYAVSSLLMDKKLSV